MKKLLTSVFYSFLFLLFSGVLGTIVTIEYDRPFLVRFAVGIISTCILFILIGIGFLISEGIEMYKDKKDY